MEAGPKASTSTSGSYNVLTLPPPSIDGGFYGNAHSGRRQLTDHVIEIQHFEFLRVEGDGELVIVGLK